MCGRYTLTSQEGLVADLELALGEPAEPGEWWRPRFNVAPTQPAPVVANREGPRAIEMMRWGLVPYWADEPSIGSRLINARVETAATTPAYRDAVRRRRCLVLADGFYEWRKEGKKKTPVYLRPVPRRPIAFAGVWDRWRAPDGVWVLSFSILTGPPNALVAPIHDRMPVIVPHDAYARWLQPGEVDPASLADLFAPAPVDDWRGVEVSPHVNKPDNDDPQCIEPAAPAAQGSLF